MQRSLMLQILSNVSPKLLLKDVGQEPRLLDICTSASGRTLIQQGSSWKAAFLPMLGLFLLSVVTAAGGASLIGTLSASAFGAVWVPAWRPKWMDSCTPALTWRVTVRTQTPRVLQKSKPQVLHKVYRKRPGFMFSLDNIFIVKIPGSLPTNGTLEI